MKKLNKNGQELWFRAKKSIPGGNCFLSKRPERFVPGKWPPYYSKAKGITIYDVEGKSYKDFSLMGVGTCILGYCDDDVDSAVKRAISSGVNTSLNAPEEVLLAERLLDLNPFAGGVKFARTGGEAMSIAVRIARTFTGKEKIAFSGYHGWSDWYLAANIEDVNNLSGHLLPGLNPLGVPKVLINTALPFKYNDVDSFLKTVNGHEDIGTIIIEGGRKNYPSDDFLNAIAEVAARRKMIIIFDEITSGWRVADGGVYKTLDFTPDIVVYGKGMGNGYAISSVIGKTEVMESAENTFISSSFWTERIGFVAALETIGKFEQNQVWAHLIRVGTRIGNGWEDLGKKYDIQLRISDFKPLITMEFNYGSTNNALATLFSQEMLKRGYLASTSTYVSFSHTNDLVDEYLNNVEEVFQILSNSIKDGSVDEKLDTKPKEEGFKRLT